MSDLHTPSSQPGEPSSRARAAHRVLVFVVAAEALGLWLGFAWLVFELGTARPDSLSSALALIVLVGVLALWISATAIALARRIRWSRGSTITWQVLQTAIAFGASQGANANGTIALALFIPAALAFGIVVSRTGRSMFRLED
ncbi:MAG TPA: hypothetical protein VK139_00675 [Microbacteriaceae bacterium]|nr:hypothetical protein [Microbacteriaceae bacterium]